MRVTYHKLCADGTETTHAHDFSGAPENWYSHVRQIFAEHFGEDIYYEHVNVWHQGEYRDMFVDETSALKGLPVNAKATEIYHANVKAHFPDEFSADMPLIYGDALLFDQRVWI